MFRATDRGRVASHRHASRGRPAEVLRNRPACANQPEGIAPWLYPVTEARQFCGTQQRNTTTTRGGCDKPTSRFEANHRRICLNSLCTEGFATWGARVHTHKICC